MLCRNMLVNRILVFPEGTIKYPRLAELAARARGCPPFLFSEIRSIIIATGGGTQTAQCRQKSIRVQMCTGTPDKRRALRKGL